MTQKTEPGVDVAQAARAELYDTLAQLRERLDFAQRIDNRVHDAQERVAAFKRARPVAFAIGAATVAAGAGAVVWLVAKRVARSFS